MDLFWTVVLAAMAAFVVGFAVANLAGLDDYDRGWSDAEAHFQAHRTRPW